MILDLKSSIVLKKSDFYVRALNTRYVDRSEYQNVY